MTRVIEYIELETRPWVDDQSPAADDVVWRWTKPTEGTPKDIEAIPSVKSIAFTPATISLGENLGTRASLTVTFADHRHIFNGESFDAGTFFGKWRGRFGQRLRGKPLRWIRGTIGQTLDQMETWHFIVEAVNGPTPDGVYTITAQDVLKLADDDRALAPKPSGGSTLADIDTDDTSVTLGPTGIGDIDYPASGFVNIAGKEICAFTRSGDVLSLTRNTTVPGTTFETEVAEHKAGSRVQLCLSYIAEDPADIIADLFTTYADVDSDFIDTTAWQTETDAFLQTLYTTIITEPTGVNKLVTELVQQAGLAIWWDALEQTMRLQVLRAVPTTAAEFNEDKFLRGSLRTQDQPGKRISEVLAYFGLRNPLRPIDQDDNYRATLLTPDLDAAEEYNGAVTKTIKSRWIPFGGQQVAERMSFIQLGRYRDPPRKISFDTWRFAGDVPELGQGYQIGWTENQASDGTAALAPIQVTRLNPQPERYSVEAEEALWTFYEATQPGGLNNRTIIISSNINNVNLRTMHDNIYPAVTDDDVTASPPVTLTVIVNENVIIGSTASANPAFDAGSWPTGFVPKLVLNGRIQGKGGNGTPPSASSARHGGTALYARTDLDVEYGTDAEIWGGGGGGGGFGASQNGQDVSFGGGGGAGQVPGSAGNTTGDLQGSPAPEPGTTEAGGDGTFQSFPFGTITSGEGGGPGQNGEPSRVNGAFFAAGGNAGAAIDGVSFLNVLSGSADVRGSTIN